MKISNKGLAGEFYVLAQLNARGYDASLTLGNTKGVDILVMNNDKNIGFKVEVKTSNSKPTNEKSFKDWHSSPTYTWILSKKNETYIAENLIKEYKPTIVADHQCHLVERFCLSLGYKKVKQFEQFSLDSVFLYQSD